MSPSITTSSSHPNLRRRKSSLLPSSSSTTDPLTLALLPPANETPAECAARLHAEKLAKQRSDEIDRLLKHDASTSSSIPASSLPSESSAAGSSKKGRVYKMVLLGQAGAGKTTVLKQMRLLYDPAAHERERKGWVKIVLLNLTAGVRVLLATVELYVAQRGERRSEEMSRIVGSSSAPSDAEGKEVAESETVVGEEAEPWVAHLPAIAELERQLRAELGALGEEVQLSGCSTTKPFGGEERVRDRSTPLLLRPGWQERLFTYARRSLSLPSSSSRNAHPSSSSSSSSCDSEENASTLSLLRTVQPSVLALWTNDPRVRALHKRGLFLDSQSDSATSYFLDNYARIVSLHYSPTDDDILHSRVRTLGVTEDVFRVDRSLLYRIYDVGGSRSQRTAWAPFLDDVESIIFLAPLSAFDQPLVEDPSTNRLADTFSLFNSIVSNPLLQGASMILFLNKIDLLEKKLRSGVRLAKYWPEYGGDNDFEAVWRWFRSKFRDCVRRAEDEAGAAGRRRRLYVHTTVATSTVQIRAILMSVKDSILRENLKVTGLVG